MVQELLRRGPPRVLGSQRDRIAAFQVERPQASGTQILIERTGHVAVMLRSLLAEDSWDDWKWSVAYLRERLAEHPAQGYKTWEARAAELEAASCEQVERTVGEAAALLHGDLQAHRIGGAHRIAHGGITH